MLTPNNNKHFILFVYSTISNDKLKRNLSQKNSKKSKKTIIVYQILCVDRSIPVPTGMYFIRIGDKVEKFVKI